MSGEDGFNTEDAKIAEKKGLARRGIGDLTEDGSSSRTRCRGQVGGALVNGFVRKHRKGKGFFGIFGNA